MTQIRVFKDTKLRANEFALYTSPDGTRYPQVPRDLLEWADIAAPPDDYTAETYDAQEIMEPPYVIFTKKSDEQLEQLRQGKVRQEIATLEAGQARAVREAALGDKTYLQVLEDKIAALRATL